MGIFGKSQLQKAIEQRDEIIRVLQSKLANDLPAGEFGKLMNQTMMDIARHKEIILLKGMDANKIVAISNSVGKAKEFFLSALFDAAKSFSELTPDSASKPLADQAALALIEVYISSAQEIANNRKDYKLAKETLLLALSKAYYVKEPYSLTMILLNLAAMEINLNDDDNARQRINEALPIVDYQIKNPKSTADLVEFQNLRKELIIVQGNLR
jgi:hypothetical protein